jgi:cytochrome b6-f complex iron-sulfur subunit
MNRRELLRWFGWGAAGAFLGGGGVCLSSREAERDDLPVLLGPLSGLGESTVRDFPALGVALLRSERGLAFVSSRCTHLGCKLGLVGDAWVCPCHGGRFSVEGAVLGGPPVAPLSWLEGGVTFSGVVYVFPSRRTVGGLYRAV